MTRSNRLVNSLFWLIFVCCLGISVPHIAWCFHAYENQTNDIISVWGISVSLWWLISYAFALVWDLLILGLSYLNSRGDATDVAVTWVAVGIITLVSFFLNVVYSIAHAPIDTVPWNISIAGIATIGSISTFIVSASPLFMNGFTYMLSRLNRSALTSEQLEKLAGELEKQKKQATRIKEIKGGLSLKEKIKRVANDIAEVKDALQTSFNGSQKAVETPILSGDSIDPSEGTASSELLQAQREVLREGEKSETHQEEVVTISSNGHSTSSQNESLERYVPKLKSRQESEDNPS